MKNILILLILLTSFSVIASESGFICNNKKVFTNASITSLLEACYDSLKQEASTTICYFGDPNVVARTIDAFLWDTYVEYFITLSNDGNLIEYEYKHEGDESPIKLELKRCRL